MTRHYRVFAINRTDTSEASDTANATTRSADAPGAPTNLRATADGQTVIVLNWTAPADTGGSAITGYKIEKSTDGGTTWANQRANTRSTATTYRHTGLSADTTLHYRVSAINNNDTGGPSNVASATTRRVGGAPGRPTNLRARPKARPSSS